MPYNKFNTATDGLEEKSLAYDLRVFYALVVGRKMMAIEDAITAKDYPKWFRETDLLFKTIYSRIDVQRDPTKQEYEKAKQETLVTINKYSKDYLRKSHDAKAIWEIEEALSRLQHLVYRAMHASNQFGSDVSIRGL